MTRATSNYDNQQNTYAQKKQTISTIENFFFPETSFKDNKSNDNTMIIINEEIWQKSALFRKLVDSK